MLHSFTPQNNVKSFTKIQYAALKESPHFSCEDEKYLFKLDCEVTLLKN